MLNRRNLTILGTVLLVLLAVVIYAYWPRMPRNLTFINAPGGDQYALVSGINDNGDIVGLYIGPSHAACGFELTHGRYMVTRSLILDINNSGEMTLHGGSLLVGGMVTRLSAPANMHDVDLRRINNRGQIVGAFITGNDYAHQHGLLYDHGHFTELFGPDGRSDFVPGAINDLGQIVGSAGNSSRDLDKCYLLDNGRFKLLNPPGLRIIATGINNKGEIVGIVEADRPNVEERPFTITNGVFRIYKLPVPAWFVGLNNNGQIIGRYKGETRLRSLPGPPYISMENVTRSFVLNP